MCLYPPASVQYYGLEGKRVVAVTSGANMNFDRLRLVSGECVFGWEIGRDVVQLFRYC